jgi:hypothetical protein
VRGDDVHRGHEHEAELASGLMMEGTSASYDTYFYKFVFFIHQELETLVMFVLLVENGQTF